MKKVGMIGYSGHAYVAIDSFHSMGRKVSGYFEFESKSINPFDLEYLGSDEKEQLIRLSDHYDYFVGIGDNHIRRKITELYYNIDFINAIHSSAIIGSNVILGRGVLIAPNVAINALSIIGNGVICNTGSIIEHECEIGNYAHLAPGSVLCGNVSIGENTFIGANSVVKQGVKIGNNVVVGAGSVVIKDIEDNQTVVGNPARKI